MKKMLVSDYDGTFYTDEDNVKLNVEEVEKFRRLNNLFVIATGRSYYDFGKKKKKYDIKYDYLVINHGATILNKEEETISNYVIDENVKLDLVKELDLQDQEIMFACSGLESRVSIKNKNITKINKKYRTLEEAKEINDYINKKYKDKVESYLLPTSNAVEVISAKTNKAKAVQELSNLENIKKDNVYTIGDSYNDVEMIEKFNGYSIENAKEEVKKVSKGECSSVSKLIKKLINE